jgi:hypothetical protein
MTTLPQWFKRFLSSPWTGWAVSVTLDAYSFVSGCSESYTISFSFNTAGAYKLSVTIDGDEVGHSLCFSFSESLSK